MLPTGQVCRDGGCVMTGSIRPPAGPPRPYTFPAAQLEALPNGLTVAVVPMRRLPIVTALLMSDAGAECDLAATAGVASLAVDAQTEGTIERDGAALADAFEQLGGSLDTAVDVGAQRGEHHGIDLAIRWGALPAGRSDPFSFVPGERGTPPSRGADGRTPSAANRAARAGGRHVRARLLRSRKPVRDSRKRIGSDRRSHFAR